MVEDATKDETEADLLKNFVGPIAQFKKNPDVPFWLNLALHPLFEAEKVFLHMENNS
mgnify:CR=1 FL=1